MRVTEAGNDNPFLDDQSGVDDPFDSLISAAVGTDDDATASVPLFDDADLFAPTFGNSSANSNAALSSGSTFGSMSGRNNSAQNSNRSGSAGLFGDQLGTGGSVDTSAQPPSDALFGRVPGVCVNTRFFHPSLCFCLIIFHGPLAVSAKQT